MILTTKQQSKKFVDTFDLYLLLIDGKNEAFKTQLHGLVKSDTADDALFEIWVNQNFDYQSLIENLKAIMTQCDIQFPVNDRDLREIKEGVAIWKYLNGKMLGIDLLKYCWTNVMYLNDTDPINDTWIYIDHEIDCEPNPMQHEEIIKRMVMKYVTQNEPKGKDHG